MFAFVMPGPTELLIIGGIIILLFGAGQLPKIARSLGGAIPSFKKGMAEVEKEVDDIKKELTI